MPARENSIVDRRAKKPRNIQAFVVIEGQPGDKNRINRFGGGSERVRKSEIRMTPGV
jgi:hypothetical protein